MKFIRTNSALNIVFLFLPFSLVPLFHVGPAPVFILELAIIAAVITFAVEIKSLRVFFRTLVAPLRQRGILLLALGMTVGVFVATDPLTALSRLRAWIIEPLLIFALLTPVIATSVTRLHEKILFAVIGVTAITLFGFTELLTSTEESPDGRLQAIFTNANMLAFLLAPFFVLAVGKFFTAQRKHPWLIFAVILAVGLVLTKSYGAILAVGAVALFGLWLFARQLGFKRTVGILAALILAGGLFINSEQGSEKWQSLFNFNDRNSTTIRLEIQQVGLGIIRESPIFGIGLGQFPAIYERDAYRLLDDRNPLEWAHPEPHNVFLAVWLAGGILALTGFLEIIWLALRSGLRRLKKATMVQFAGLALLMILIHGLVDTTFLRADLALIFWFLIFTIDPTNKNQQIKTKGGLKK